MSLQSFINGPFGIGLVLAIGKFIPPSIGFSLADKAAKFITSRKNADFIRASRANQWIATGERFSSEELDKQVFENFRLTARIIYDLYHNINNYQAIRDRIALSPKLRAFLEARIGEKEGTLLVAPHLSNFDLAGRAIVLHGYDVQALSYPLPPGGYRWQNQLRRDAGINITPMSTESMRAAKARLKNGGCVLTGIDRPLKTTNYHPHFFGYKTNLPTSYVRMALQTKSAIIAIACTGIPEENYVIECSDLIYMEPANDAVVEIEKNAEKVLVEIEKFIRQYPTQWAMTYPVWPFALDKMP